MIKNQMRAALCIATVVWFHLTGAYGSNTEGHVRTDCFGQTLSPAQTADLIKYKAKVLLLIKRNWNMPRTEDQPLPVLTFVEENANIGELKIIRSSGNRSCDELAKALILKISRDVPKLPQGIRKLRVTVELTTAILLSPKTEQ